MHNVHVGVQIRRNPEQLVRADVVEARWGIDVEVVRDGDVIDFRGPAVHGTRGERFIYLTWGDLGATDEFEMFRRAKLMLDRVQRTLIEKAIQADRLDVVVDLTGGDGGPRCARVDPPAVEWSVPKA